MMNPGANGFSYHIILLSYHSLLLTLYLLSNDTSPDQLQKCLIRLDAKYQSYVFCTNKYFLLHTDELVPM